MSAYFDPTAVAIPSGSRAVAAQVNSGMDAVSAGFDMLPTETELKQGTTRYAVDSGVADAYIVTLPYVPVLTDGLSFSFKATNANTGPATINANATGIRSIVNPDGSALIAGTFGANAIVILAYEGIAGRYILVSQNPAQSALAQSSAIASAASAAAASTSEGNAATSETNAATSETNASTSEGNAGTSETNAAATLADFETKYLGAAAADPTLDLVGGALIDGALYWNTTTNLMMVYDLGITTWGQLPGDLTGQVTTAANVATVRVAAITDQTLMATNIADADEFLMSDGGVIKRSIFSRIHTYVAAKMVAAGNTWALLQTFNGGLAATAASADVVSTTATATTSTALLAYSNEANRTVAVAEIVNDNPTGAGEALFIQQDQGGNGIRLLQNFVGTSQAVFLGVIGDATNTGNVFQAQTSGIGPGFYSNAINAASRAFSAYSIIPSRTSPLVDIVNDHATGTGVGLRIQQDQGGAAIDLTSQGTVKFPVTSTPSTDVNTLDDYQEGIWSPVLSDGTNDATMNGAITVGYYTKIGRVVHIHCRVATSDITGPGLSGNLRINGGPFANDSALPAVGGMTSITADGLNIAAGQHVTTNFGSNTTSIFVYLSDLGTGTSNMQASEWTDDGNVVLSGWYTTSE